MRMMRARDGSIMFGFPVLFLNIEIGGNGYVNPDKERKRKIAWRDYSIKQIRLEQQNRSG